MKARIKYPKCPRCGYEYNPKKRRRVLVFKRDDGEYAGCDQCITEFGAYLKEKHTDDEKKAFLESFKVPDHREVGGAGNDEND